MHCRPIQAHPFAHVRFLQQLGPSESNLEEWSLGVLFLTQKISSLRSCKYHWFYRSRPRFDSCLRIPIFFVCQLLMASQNVFCRYSKGHKSGSIFVFCIFALMQIQTSVMDSTDVLIFVLYSHRSDVGRIYRNGSLGTGNPVVLISYSYKYYCFYHSCSSVRFLPLSSYICLPSPYFLSIRKKHTMSTSLGVKVIYYTKKRTSVILSVRSISPQLRKKVILLLTCEDGLNQI